MQAISLPNVTPLLRRIPERDHQRRLHRVTVDRGRVEAEAADRADCRSVERVPGAGQHFDDVGLQYLLEDGMTPPSAMIFGAVGYAVVYVAILLVITVLIFSRRNFK